MSEPKTIFGKHYPQPLRQSIINGIIGATRLKSVRVVQSLDLPALMLRTRDICDNRKIAKLLRFLKKQAQFWLKLKFSKVNIQYWFGCKRIKIRMIIKGIAMRIGVIDQ